jgi:hypothetical protein
VNEELEEKASLLAEQNSKVEQKNAEVEAAAAALEEKAEQLALSSKYKSEFLANMSHELRTPLNSLLILAKLLADNKEGNLTEKQVEFAQTILGAGTDLLNLINDVLDLSKVEAGKMEISPTNVYMKDVTAYVDRSFRPMADQKGLQLNLLVDEGVPESVFTDGQRLQQVLKNLLSNAFKFTERGGITLGIARRTRAALQQPHAGRGGHGDRLLGDGHRHRHRAGEAAADLRGVSSRRTAPPAAATAAPGWGSPSAARSRACWAARSGWRARRARGAPSPSSCRAPGRASRAAAAAAATAATCRATRLRCAPPRACRAPASAAGRARRPRARGTRRTRSTRRSRTPARSGGRARATPPRWGSATTAGS